MKIFRHFPLITAFFCMIPAASSAQTEPGTGLFTPGSSFDIQMMNVEPVWWANQANEVNAYIELDGRKQLLTLQSNTKFDIPKLPKITKVTYTNHGFMLHGEDGTGYYFGMDTPESKQVLDIIDYGVTGKISVYNGYGVARHYWPQDKGPKLTDLQAAASVYDVLGKPK